MRKLHGEEIEYLARKKGVRKIAVENFLSTMGDDYMVAMQNLRYDERSYGWNKATVDAIREGIKMANG